MPAIVLLMKEDARQNGDNGMTLEDMELIDNG